MDLWTALLDVLVLLLAAMLLGALCERLRQNAIIGYLLAGTLLGPNALDLMPNHKAVVTIAELGVTLLLFTIGLEFSWRSLRRIGPIAFGGGTLQVILTGVVAAGVCMLLGLGASASTAVGAMIALSSTACVLRLLVSRAEIDSVYGRNALGILLLQDIAVVPLVLVVTVLGEGGSIGQLGWRMARAVGAAALLVAALYLLLNYVVPRLLGAREAARNRELPILLAIVTAVGAAWASHMLGVSPILGAFIAGMLLAESPFATQVRADVGSLRTLFVTLFFSSIGMLGDPAWALEHWTMLIAVVAAIVFGKMAITSGVAFLLRSPLGHSIATAICLAQVGEFSFVLAELARHGDLLGDDVFNLMVSATIVTLFLTPYLVAIAPRLGAIAGRLPSRGTRKLPGPIHESTQPETRIGGHVLVVGFGPAGQGAAESLMTTDVSSVVVVELNQKTASVARALGLEVHIGDASRAEVLEHARVGSAKVVVVTVPDPTAAQHVIERVRSLSSDAIIVARARYHMHRSRLVLAGAHVVIDEEEEVGLQIAAAAKRSLHAQRDDIQSPEHTS